MVSTDLQQTILTRDQQDDMDGNEDAPEEMQTGSAVVHGNTAYFGSNKVYSYQNVLGKEQWSPLPDNPNRAFGLSVIDGLFTGDISTLLNLIGEGERKQWSEFFPPMPTACYDAVCITTEKALVVAGGGEGYTGNLDTVEVITSTQNSGLCLSPSTAVISGITCEDTIYLAGGINNTGSKTVFTCSLYT